mgnify:CR=1 FL=1
MEVYKHHKKLSRLSIPFLYTLSIVPFFELAPYPQTNEGHRHNKFPVQHLRLNLYSPLLYPKYTTCSIISKRIFYILYTCPILNIKLWESLYPPIHCQPPITQPNPGTNEDPPAMAKAAAADVPSISEYATGLLPQYTNQNWHDKPHYRPSTYLKRKHQLPQYLFQWQQLYCYPHE